MNDKDNSEKDGIRIEIMRESQLAGMGKIEKIGYIIDIVKSGRIVLLESGLTSDEHSLLIEKTMSQIDQDRFTGIDIESYSKNNTEEDRGFLGRVLNRKDTTSENNLTVIGPANQMETLHKDEKQISAIFNPYP